MKDQPLSDFTIKNGSLEDPMYPYDLHCFFEKETLRVVLLLPGIIGESVLITTKDNKMKIRASIHRNFRQIFKSAMLDLTYTLPVQVRENVRVSSYQYGALEIKLIIETLSKYE